MSSNAHLKQTNQMWGGRFETGPSEIMSKINASIDFDKRLYQHDIRASKVHARMLARPAPQSGIRPWRVPGPTAIMAGWRNDPAPSARRRTRPCSGSGTRRAAGRTG